MKQEQIQVPALGSPAWEEELQHFGVSLAEAQLLLDLALEQGGFSDKGADAHRLDLNLLRILDTLTQEGEPIEHKAWPGLRKLADLQRQSDQEDQENQDAYLVLHAAAWLLFHERHPGYAAMMYLRIESWFPIKQKGGAKVEWFARQLAALWLHGSPAVVDSVEYSLGVDYFEDQSDATLLFPRLVALLPEKQEDLLVHSGYIAWEAKRGFYAALVNTPHMHEPLARALQKSLHSAFFRTINAAEALALLNRMQLEDSSLGETLRAGLTTPIQAEVLGVIRILGPLEEWQRIPGNHLLALKLPPAITLPSWFCGCEIWERDQCHGVLTQARYGLHGEDPFLEKPPYNHRAPPYTKWDASDGSTAEWHAVESSADLSMLLGKALELWPPGIQHKSAHSPSFEVSEIAPLDHPRH